MRKQLVRMLAKSPQFYWRARMARLWVARRTPAGIKQYRRMVSFYSQFVRAGDLCFDVGANVGSRTDVFLALGTKVVCIEPQESFQEVLRKKFRNNKNVTLVDQAVGDSEGSADLMICQEAPSIATLSMRWTTEGRFSIDHRWTKMQRVPTTTLDVLISLYGLPTFCKVDVEGFEEPVLKGLTVPIPCLSFEFNREFLGEVRKCVDHLEALGRVEFNCSLGDSMRMLLPAWVPAGVLHESLDSPGDQFLWGDVYARFI